MQTAYIDELLRKFGMEKCNLSPTPMVAHTRLSRSDCPEKPIPGLCEKYREMVGSYQTVVHGYSCGSRTNVSWSRVGNEQCESKGRTRSEGTEQPGRGIRASRVSLEGHSIT
eukprot:188707-Rhodomonas_salina.1